MHPMNEYKMVNAPLTKEWDKAREYIKQNDPCHSGWAMYLSDSEVSMRFVKQFLKMEVQAEMKIGMYDRPMKTDVDRIIRNWNPEEPFYDWIEMGDHDSWAAFIVVGMHHDCNVDKETCIELLELVNSEIDRY